MVYLEATVVDDAGNVVPGAVNELHFTVSGSARMVGVDNGNSSDHDPFQAEMRRAYQSRAIAIVAAFAPGAVTVTVSAAGLPEAKASFNGTAASSARAAGRVIRSF